MRSRVKRLVPSVCMYMCVCVRDPKNAVLYLAGHISLQKPACILLALKIYVAKDASESRIVDRAPYLGLSINAVHFCWSRGPHAVHDATRLLQHPCAHRLIGVSLHPPVI